MTKAYRPYLQPLIKELASRGQRSAQSLMAITNPALRKHLQRQLSGEPGSGASLLADPVFEPTFGWEESNVDMKGLSGDLLHSDLVTGMANPPKELAEDYTFPLDRKPFTHQLAAWEILSAPEPRSLVVTSGTGSGKTECFLVPILNRLAQQADTEGHLQGVRALFIYPLNALIASQQKRLDAWTEHFAGKVRYCLYTGNLPDVEKKSQRIYQGTVLDRKSLREDSPPMMITNATMLEYMLVRKEDQTILEQSQGKLEWIVLDEAHTHIGSQAAEMAMLLRRVMLAFGVKPQNVRFVATSATFGDSEETRRKLQAFLADMAGVSPEQVVVVHGRRQVPVIGNKTVSAGQVPSLQALQEIDPQAEQSQVRFDALSVHPHARALREAFNPEGNKTQVQTLSDLTRRFAEHDWAKNRSTLLHWLDLLSGTKDKDGQSFLPLRIHLFHNVLSGLFACVDPACSHLPATLGPDSGWGFGNVYSAERTSCDCGAPVLPIVACRECNTEHLAGIISSKHELLAPRHIIEDEFALETEEAGEPGEDDHTEFKDHERQVLVCHAQASGKGEQVWLNKASKKLLFTANSSDLITIRLYEQPDAETGNDSCPCCTYSGPTGRVMRRLSLGAPFTMGVVIGTLLEFCEDDKESPDSKPFRGKKMISFTDSRQGTARIAVKLQQDSERNRIRGLIYHYLLQSQQEKQGLSASDQALYVSLTALKEQGTLPTTLAAHLQGLEEKLAQTATASLSWTEMINRLASDRDVSTGMLDHYKRQAPRVFSDSGAARLALVMMYREFARRPKTQNSLETMGLVALHYPDLDTLNQIPTDWPFDIQAWRDYLKVLLDFYVRENSFAQFDEELCRFVGMRIRPKWLISPDSPEENDSRRKKWVMPTQNSHRQPRPVSLLLKATGWDIKTHHDRISFILKEAWKTLTNSHILRLTDSGYRLDFNRVMLTLVERAGICPITRRFIDTPFAGLTPYTMAKARDAICKVEPVTIPRYPDAFGGTDIADKRLLLARDWLDHEPTVLELREKGLWSDLHDRIIEGGAWFRCVEHSAQQPRSRLNEYEELFKTGRVNLMSCSTTMEMGVDIGGISVVAMNNVPPHPANYLQRAGRAGRRREARAVAMTVCKNTPHDQAVFKRPDWPFTTHIRVPDVSLTSQSLIQRHINAWLLSHWFHQIAGQEELKGVDCEAFFLSSSGASVAERFMMWCAHPVTNLDSTLRSGLERLTANSPLARNSAESLVATTLQDMEAVRNGWRKMYDGVEQQRAVFAGEKDSNPALKALELQLSRIKGEYLLSELANRRFLPGYGFPTDVVGFDNRTISALLNKEDDKRDDNRGRYQDLPSRDRVTALREYAPGAELVMDGMVYRSAGVTLNWHIPASETDVTEAQLFKYAWRCRRCGASDNNISHRPDTCSQCGAALQTGKDPRFGIRQMSHYLVPSGFAVDFFEEPHMDISSQLYVPILSPWISVNAPWMALANPAAGQFRSSNQAHIFHHSAGSHGDGYALCLACGRMEPMLAHDDETALANERRLPHIFRTNGPGHKRLRGNKGKNGERLCPGSGSSWKIKTNIDLGHDAIGDALEVMFANPDGIGWLNDEATAYSIAVAMRTAIADMLGVMEEELGCATTPILYDGQEVRTALVFDQRSGGYSSLAAPLLQTEAFWLAVRKVLDCSDHCQTACQSCLLSFDTRFNMEKLDRNLALSVLTTHWIHQFVLPTHLKVFGSSTIPESLPLQEALALRVSHAKASEVRLFLHGSVEEWDIPMAHGLHASLQRWRASGLAVSLSLPTGHIEKLDDASRYRLANWVALGVKIDTGNNTLPGFATTACLPVAAVREGEQWMVWASDSLALATPDEPWGQHQTGARLLRGQTTLPELTGGYTENDLRPATSTDRELLVQHQLDGSVNDFGHRLWAWLTEEVPALSKRLTQSGATITRITYSDRYLRSPLTVALLVSLIDAVRKYEAGNEPFTVEVQSQTYANQRPGYGRVWDDWDDNVARDRALAKALEDCGLTATVHSLPLAEIEHARTLTLFFSDGQQLLIRLDQGVSFWRSQSHGPGQRFPFTDDVQEQSNWLIQPVGTIGAQEHSSSYIFFSQMK